MDPNVTLSSGTFGRVFLALRKKSEHYDDGMVILSRSKYLLCFDVGRFVRVMFLD